MEHAEELWLQEEQWCTLQNTSSLRYKFLYVKTLNTIILRIIGYFSVRFELNNCIALNFEIFQMKDIVLDVDFHHFRLMVIFILRCIKKDILNADVIIKYNYFSVLLRFQLT